MIPSVTTSAVKETGHRTLHQEGQEQCTFCEGCRGTALMEHLQRRQRQRVDAAQPADAELSRLDLHQHDHYSAGEFKVTVNGESRAMSSRLPAECRVR